MKVILHFYSIIAFSELRYIYQNSSRFLHVFLSITEGKTNQQPKNLHQHLLK